jgi:hypothetical protein
MVRSAGRSRLRGANLPPKAGGLGHQGSPAAAPLEKVWVGVDRQSEDLGDDCQGCWRSSLTTLPSLTVEAGPILDLAIDQSVALMRTELYGEATTTPSQERHLRTAAELFTRLTLSFTSPRTPPSGSQAPMTFVPTSATTCCRSSPVLCTTTDQAKCPANLVLTGWSRLSADLWRSPRTR